MSNSKTLRFPPLALAIVLALSSTAAGASETTNVQKWVGSWTLDRAQSHLIGPAITIGRVAHGYHFDFGAVAFDVGDDGKDYPTVPTRTTSIKQTAPSQWYRVHKVNGAEVDHSVLVVSKDGGTMTIATVARAADGTTHSSDETLQRIGAGVGLAGTWRSGSEGVNVSPEIQITAGDGGKLPWSLPRDKQYCDVVPDGPAVPLLGSGSIPGLTMLVQRDGDGLRWTNYVNAKPWMYGIDKVSADGLRLEETTWTPARPEDKQVAVYRRETAQAR
jgi:hypothetical protein